tara:strand:+ start:917 stop:1180 length:264 start_codon:yes stop_codon:yes gene_type:complete
MKFNCKKCNETKNIYKVKFVSVGSDLVCKDAHCCNEYMDQVITDEYVGMPEIKRPDSDTNHHKKSIDINKEMGKVQDNINTGNWKNE